MNILLLGADGFIGRHLEAALRAAGHAVSRGVRHAKTADDLLIDYRRDHDAARWQARLAGVEVVINAVGILGERQRGDFDSLHVAAPRALFDACKAMGVSRVVQISALGAESRLTPYLASKCDADCALLAAGTMAIVVRPALVFGLDGRSSRFFLALASLPLHALPSEGRQALRPIHIDDLAELVLRLIERPACGPLVLEAVGGQTVSYRELLAVYRQNLGLPPAPAWPLPRGLLAAAACVGGCFPQALLRRETLRMLYAGNSADDGSTRQILGRAARSPETFIAAGEKKAARLQALADWRAPLLRCLLAFLWLWSGAVSLLWPETGRTLLAALGLQGVAADSVLLLAAAADMLFGVLTLWRPSARLWLAQGLLVIAYSLLVAVFLGEFFLHPFAPIVKNLFVLAALLLLLAEDGSGETPT